MGPAANVRRWSAVRLRRARAYAIRPYERARAAWDTGRMRYGGVCDTGAYAIRPYEGDGVDLFGRNKAKLLV